uniref:CUB domain-containing protein n=1 Tax=Meleagris gallopavo TaxID=9103 RepID=A0A803YAF1_MELGA
AASDNLIPIYLLLYSSVIPCGGRLNSKDAGYITSPGYPNDYPSHQNCEWVIYAPEPNQKIILNFNPHFEIEKHDCKYEPSSSSLVHCSLTFV